MLMAFGKMNHGEFVGKEWQIIRTELMGPADETRYVLTIDGEFWSSADNCRALLDEVQEGGGFVQERWKKYMVYLDDGQQAFRIAVPAPDEDAAKEFVAGNGDVVAIRDVSEDYMIKADRVSSALAAAGFSDVEIDYVVRTLEFTRIAER